MRLFTKTRNRRAVRIAKIITEGLDQVVKNTSNIGLPKDEIVKKYEQLQDKLIWSQVLAFFSAIFFAIPPLLHYYWSYFMVLSGR